MRIVVIKIGTQVLVGETGVRAAVFNHLVDSIAVLRQHGFAPVLVTSGAGGTGRALLPRMRAHDLPEQVRKQVWAATGQAALMQRYARRFARHGVVVAQALITALDFTSHEHKKNLHACLTALLAEGVLPILNENDVVATKELMFTDNDELASLIAQDMQAEQLVILSSVDGVYTKNPREPGAEFIPLLHARGMRRRISTTGTTDGGRGGMQSKCAMAFAAARKGVVVTIANGFTKNVLVDVVIHNKKIGTRITK